MLKTVLKIVKSSSKIIKAHNKICTFIKMHCSKYILNVQNNRLVTSARHSQANVKPVTELFSNSSFVIKYF